MDILIPMAGAGSRFKKQGYKQPKPFIDINGQAMVEVVLRNLSYKDTNFHLIMQESHYDQYHDICKKIQTDYNVSFSFVDGLTEGTACTVLAAKDYLLNASHITICNVDQYIVNGIGDFLDYTLEKDPVGSIMTFYDKERDPRWSFVKFNDSGNIIATKEKDPISNHATVGVYYFKSGDYLVNAIETMISKDDRTNGEFYVCPSYNYLDLGQSFISNFTIDQDRMLGMGTPEELNRTLTNNLFLI